MKQQDNWPEALSELRIPEPSANFAARIIQAAKPRPIQEFTWQQALWSLIQPKVGFAMAFGLLLGVSMGWQDSSMSLLADLNSMTIGVESPASETILDTFYFESGDIL